MTAYLSILCFVAGLSFAASEAVVFGPNTWAVLVAGSSGWYNYRHQADICHAYHSLLQKGVQKDRIITLMYDDIANNHQNPTKGIIVNQPDGKDVYQGVVIDYKGKDVSAKNFLNILEGNVEALKSIGSGRVLKSTENDTVFVNFADHGGTGVLGFPETALYVKDLIATLNRMSEKKVFGKLILFIEACEAGSMFDGLIDHLKNVYVSTASARDESSWGCYCEDKKYKDTCLGDLFSVKWMERLDELKTSESLFDNYNAIRTAVTKSHVQLYGDYSEGFLELFDSEKIEDKYQTEYSSASDEDSNGVDSRDIPLYIAKKSLEAADDPASIMLNKEKLENIIQGRGYADKLISKILEVYTEGDIDSQLDLESKRMKLDLDMLSCYEDLLNAFDSNCFSIPKNTYFMKHLYKLANICVKYRTSIKAVTAIQAVCNDEFDTINNLGVNIE